MSNWKVGNLVKSIATNSKQAGVVINIEASYELMFVCWGDYSTWVRTKYLEVISEN